MPFHIRSWGPTAIHMQARLWKALQGLVQHRFLLRPDGKWERHLPNCPTALQNWAEMETYRVRPETRPVLPNQRAAAILLVHMKALQNDQDKQAGNPAHACLNFVCLC